MFFNTPAFCKNHNTNINIRKSELLNGLWHRIICKIFVLQDFDDQTKKSCYSISRNQENFSLAWNKN